MTTPSIPEAGAADRAARADRSEIEEKVRQIIAESLGCEPSTVTLQASLTDELGAESLDFLDIVFKIERTFDVQITRGEMERAARGDMTDEAFAPGGVISAEGIERLRTLMPEAAARITPGLHVMQIMNLFTARTFASIVEAKRQPK